MKYGSKFRQCVVAMSVAGLSLLAASSALVKLRAYTPVPTLA